MQGQEKLTFIVILLFFSMTLCCTLISANEKVLQTIDNADDPLLITDTHFINSFLPIHVCQYLFRSISNSVKTIFTMPFVLRRLTLAECCSWFVMFDFLFVFNFIVQHVRCHHDYCLLLFEHIYLGRLL
jgi:hypothetical protein